jgi:hypothetical protein
MGCIEWQLYLPILARGRGGKDLANPVRYDFKAVIPWDRWHPLSFPASEIRDSDLDVTHKVNLRLVNDPPSTWTATALLERTHQFVAK